MVVRGDPLLTYSARLVLARRALSFSDPVAWRACRISNRHSARCARRSAACRGAKHMMLTDALSLGEVGISWRGGNACASLSSPAICLPARWKGAAGSRVTRRNWLPITSGNTGAMSDCFGMRATSRPSASPVTTGRNSGPSGRRPDPPGGGVKSDEAPRPGDR